MVILVCPKCYGPMEMVLQPQAGAALIHYRCTRCRRRAVNFLLGYVTDDEAAVGAPPARTDHRARFFQGSNRHYQLRAKMQAVLKQKARQKKPRLPAANIDPADENS